MASSILISVTTELTPTAIPVSIDGIEFVMISSTASEVSAESPTRFRYQQDGQMIWGAYIGDTVRRGRFVGRRDGDVLTVCFAHRPIDGGAVVLGTATSELVRQPDGALHLVETFEKNGAIESSVCVEVPPTDELSVSVGDPGSRLDQVSFVLETTTASVVNEDAPTRFDFNEADGVVWGLYTGDTVTTGHCVGRNEGGILQEYFVHHVVASDATLLGDSTTRVQTRDDGRLELVEDFVLDGVPGYSVCVQIS